MTDQTGEPVGTTSGAATAKALQALFAGAEDFCCRELTVRGARVQVCYLDGITAGGEIASLILRPLCTALRPGTAEELYAQALAGALWPADVSACGNAGQAADRLVNGCCTVIFAGVGALACEVKSPERRGISPPEVENTAKGAKDSFTETLRTNTALVRRHLRTPALRLWRTVVGRRSRTAVDVVYLAGLTDPALVRAVKRRLAQLDIDGLTTPAAVEEYLTGSRATAFPLLQSTQRTDRFATALLAGRLGILVDGLPVGWLAPVNLGYLMSAAEDRGTDYLSASFVRLLRYGALLTALLLPALYVAMAEFHQEMIPTALLQAMIESKQRVPFPTVLEVLGLLLAFEILQEAGTTLPQAISQTVSIIGGLVVGTAAVEANLISPAALIVVAVAGICGFALPAKELTDAIRLWRLGLAVAASFAGLFGLTLGLLALTVRLASLESFGLAYLAPFSGLHAGALIRPRLCRQRQRDPALHPLDPINQSPQKANET